MNHFKYLGQENREKIVDYLQSVPWADVKTITLNVAINRESVYSHCHNLVREGILDQHRIEIMGRMTMIFSISHH
jgi:predicted ArsR family transcriptional regulator